MKLIRSIISPQVPEQLQACYVGIPKRGMLEVRHKLVGDRCDDLRVEGVAYFAVGVKSLLILEKLAIDL